MLRKLSDGAPTLYMVVEHFGDATIVYRGFRDSCRLDEWMAQWRAVVDLEVYSVMTPQQAAEKISPEALTLQPTSSGMR